MLHTAVCRVCLVLPACTTSCKRWKGQTYCVTATPCWRKTAQHRLHCIAGWPVVCLQALPPAEGLRVVLGGAGRTLLTLLMTLLVPAGLGAVRALLSGG